jgi:predicted DNA-binding protein with PD1-like motif
VIVGETKLTRVLVGRLEPGEWLHDALLEMARLERVDAAMVRGQGIVDLAELDVWDPALKGYGAPRRLTGTLELASLSGSVSLHRGVPDVRLHAVVAWPRAEPEPPGCAGGLLVRGRAVSVELALDVYDDGDLDRSVQDPVTGLPLWRTPRRR